MSEYEQIQRALEQSSHFSDVSYIGEGTFGKVYAARHLQNGSPTSRVVAVKVLPRSYVQHVHVQREILIHNRLVHPHVIQLKKLVVLEDHIVIVMEYADQGSLYYDFIVRHRGRYSDAEIRRLFQQLILAVDYCHKKGVADRDIKLGNCLLCTDLVTGQRLLKLADFGYSKNIDKSAARSQVGTPGYMAPEVLCILGESGTTYDGRAADMWSCGVLLFVLLFNKYPFEEDLTASPKNLLSSLYRSAMARAYRDKIPAKPDVHPACLELLHQLLDPDPATRATIRKHVLANEWFMQKLPDGYMAFNDRQAHAKAAFKEDVIIRTLEEALSKFDRPVTTRRRR